MNVSKLFDVSDKVIMITGATGNLGIEYVKGFSQSGANVVIADLQFKNCKKLADEIQEKYIHTAGNLTLTGYNSELSDKPFLEKRNMEGGFADSPIRLNSELAQLDTWNESKIVERANNLSDKAILIWKYPQLSEEILLQNMILLY